jgi:hypothetical protein
MPKPLPTDGVQLGAGDIVILLCGDYDPAHLGYFRALEALSKKGATEVWVAPLCPRGQEDVVRDMCTMLATEAFLATRKQVACCLAALTLGFSRTGELLAWCRSKYPGMRFMVAKLHGSGLEDKADIVVGFAGQELSGKDDAHLPQFLPVPGDLAERIRSGFDESRNFLAPVWEYIQKNRLYRGPHVQV